MTLTPWDGLTDTERVGLERAWWDALSERERRPYPERTCLHPDADGRPRLPGAWVCLEHARDLTAALIRAGLPEP